MSELENRVPFQPDTTAESAEVNQNFETIFEGTYHQKFAIWDNAGRPNPPVAMASYGFNTDLNGVELFMGVTVGWLLILAIWDTASRPDPSLYDLAEGSQGYNTDLKGWEGWNGTEWVLKG